MPETSEALTVVKGHETQLSKAIGQLNKQEQAIKEIIALIPSLADERLVDIFYLSEEKAKRWWIVRAFTAYEMKRRIKERGDLRGKGEDTEGRGVMKQLSALAKSVGVEKNTILDDARIVETFFKPDDNGEIEFSGEEILPRSYYHEALSAPKPEEALEIIHNKRASNPAYGRTELRQDMAQLKRNGQVTEDERVDVENVHWTPKVAVPAELWGKVMAYCDKRKVTPAEAILKGLQEITRPR